jgi:hypothetical protein
LQKLGDRIRNVNGCRRRPGKSAECIGEGPGKLRKLDEGDIPSKNKIVDVNIIEGPHRSEKVEEGKKKLKRIEE